MDVIMLRADAGPRRNAVSSGHGGAAGGLLGAYEQVASVHGHSDSVLRVAWSPDGALLASGALHIMYVLAEQLRVW